MPYRSSHRRCSVRKGVLRNFAKFTGKNLCHGLFVNKVVGLACNFIKKETLAQVFSREFCKISQNTFLQNTSGRLLLNLIKIPHKLLSRKDNSIAVQRVLYDFRFQKLFNKRFAFPLLYRDFYVLFLAAYKDHWVPRMFFVL